MARRTTKKTERAPKAGRARRGAPSRKKASKGGEASPEPDPAPTGEPGPPPGKGKVTGHVMDLADNGEANGATATQTEGTSRRRRKRTGRISAPVDPAPTGEIPDSPSPKPPAKGKKLAPGLYWNERGMINCQEHTPYKGSDTWVFEHWKKIDRASAREAKEKGMELACETCRAIAERQKATPTTTTKGRRKKKEPVPPQPKTAALDPDLTLGHLAGLYLDHLSQAGKSLATQFSYSMDIVTAKKALGINTKVAALTPERVAEYYESPEVTVRKNGKPKTKVTVDKCRRVLRLALVWAEETGLIANAPLPTTTEKK